MDPPTEGIERKPEKLGEEKDGGPLFHCDFCDADIVDKIAQSFLPGLASACIDNTTGGLFKTPANVAAEIRREMVDYLIQRSESFVAESVVLEGGPGVEVSVDPFDIISDFVDDFVHSKRNFFSRVSGWLLSEKREDWIDDLVQEMELNGFWLLNRRLSVAQTLLKNLDFKNTYHCDMKFKSAEDLEVHKLVCAFRTISCINEGCDSSFSAGQMEQHDAVCPFKMLSCEQNCSDIIMRRDMDRHCITTCPMKLVKCPFHSVGCQSTVPQRTIEQHRSENLQSHLLYILQVLHKEALVEDLKERVQELEKIASPGRLVSARDARSLTYVVKDLGAKLGPLKVNTKAKSEEVDEKVEKTDTDDKNVGLEDKNEEKTNMAAKHVHFGENPTETTANSHSEGSDDEKGGVVESSTSDHDDSSHGKTELMEYSADGSASPQTNKEEVVGSISEQESSKDSPPETEDGLSSPEDLDKQMEKSSKEEEEEEEEEEEADDDSTPTIQQENLPTKEENEPPTKELPTEEAHGEATNGNVGEESVPVQKESEIPSDSTELRMEDVRN